MYLKGCVLNTYKLYVLDYDISDHLPLLTYIEKAHKYEMPKPKTVNNSYRIWNQHAIHQINRRMAQKIGPSYRMIHLITPFFFNLKVTKVKQQMNSHL